jgi:hypothetical protein
MGHALASPGLIQQLQPLVATVHHYVCEAVANAVAILMRFSSMKHSFPEHVNV